MRKTITVNIVKKHWDAGIKNAWKTEDGEMLIHDNKCPLALALAGKFAMSAKVNGSLVNIAGQQYCLDERGAKFVATFDDHEEGYFPEFPVKVKLTLCQPEKSGK
jgi:hypothetical protein